MKLQILTPPNRPLKGKHIDEIDPNMTVNELINNILEQYPELKLPHDEQRVLITDKNTGSSFSRIILDDIMNRWYGGWIGDMYRITNASSTRYRVVIGNNSKKYEKFKASETSSTSYFRAHNTVLDMMRDRQGIQSGQTSTIDKFRRDESVINELFINDQLNSLDIREDMIVNKRGKRMFLFYLKRNDTIPASNRKQAFVKLCNDLTADATSLYNAHPAIRKQLELPDAENPTSTTAKEFADKVEIIVVYNNQYGDIPTSSKTEPIPYIQFFSVQELVFPYPEHVEQPQYYLIDPKNSDDRKEIRDMIRLNGIQLEPERTIDSYNLKDKTRLIFV